jgi:O-antigen/teichoic acid export membrane protein
LVATMRVALGGEDVTIMRDGQSKYGVPVALTAVVGALLLTADRWVVAGWGGKTMLGYYAFGASVATAATALAVVVRTVVFAEVYGDAQEGRGAAAVLAHLQRAVLPFAQLLPPLLGALGVAAGPLVAAVMPGYTPAIPSGCAAGTGAT